MSRNTLRLWRQGDIFVKKITIKIFNLEETIIKKILTNSYLCLESLDSIHHLFEPTFLKNYTTLVCFKMDDFHKNCTIYLQLLNFMYVIYIQWNI